MNTRSRISLDGQWNFSTNAGEDSAQIVVPSPWQADERFRDHSGTAWYELQFDIPAEWLDKDRVIILGFGAVDYFAKVWLNEIKVGEHEGGYLPFEFDITRSAHAGTNILNVLVNDPPEIFAEIPHGKQSWYGMISGIWQSVWVESRPVDHIQRVKISTFGETVEVEAFVSGELKEGLTTEIFSPQGRVLARLESAASRYTIRIDRPLAWSPDEPNLYTLRVSTRQDELVETFGFRTIETQNGKILLNGRPFYMRSALDQDYYPDLIYTPPSQEYIEDEFRKAKEMGLNCLRIHIKVADPRYYAAADKVGLLIWTELPNHQLLTEDAKRRARETLAGMVERDGNHPSIGIWTIINESWGIDLTDASQREWLLDTYHWLKDLDPTRLVVGNSACWGNFHVVTDIADFHMYYAMPDHYEGWREWTANYALRPWWLFAHDYQEHSEWREYLRDPWHISERATSSDVQQNGDEPLLVSEFGNWGLPDVNKLYHANHGQPPWWFETGLEWGDNVVYPHGIEQRFKNFHLDRIFPSLSALTEASQRLQYEALRYEIEQIRRHESIQGYVITEFTDLHWESNGLLDMYRNPKVHYSQWRRINSDDVLIPLWEGTTFFSGEVCVIRILCSHYSPLELQIGELQWELSGDHFASISDMQNIPFCPQFRVSELGSIEIEMPNVEQPSRVQLRLRLISERKVIASNEMDLYLFPRPSFPNISTRVHSLEFQNILSRLGYSLADDLSTADIALTAVLDDSFRDFILRGGRVLLLAEQEQALQTFVPGLEIAARAGTPWQGDWASTFGWHRFDGLPTDHVLNFAFAGLTPEHVIRGFAPRDFAFHVYAGLFAGWLHKPMPTIARKQMGRGEILVSTFRLAQHLESNPMALYLLAELLQLL